MHVAEFDQALDVAIAEALDVHHAAAGEMQDGLGALRAARKTAGATRHRLARLAHRMRAADRAGIRHRKGLRVGRATLGDDADHLGNDIAGTTHDHRVADAEAALALDFVGVVQSRVGHRNAADEHRLQTRHRRQRAGAADLDVDRLDHGQRFLRRIFVRHRPARLARTESEALLQFEAIDLVHHAIDIEG